MQCEARAVVKTASLAAKCCVYMLVLLFSFSAAASDKSIEPLKIAVAANFAQPIKLIAATYTEQTGTPVRVTVGSSGHLFAQISRGAHYDVFLSADSARPKALVTDGKVTEADVFPYAKGKLAVIGIADYALENSLTWQHLAPIVCNASQRIAIANPLIAPYGKAAEQVLFQGNAWACAQPSLVKGNNVIQAFQFYESGNVSLAFVAQSLVIGRNDVVEVPSELHEPIVQSLAITATLESKQSARAFVDFLLSENVQKSIVALGYESVTSVSGGE